MCVTSPPYWGLRDYGTALWEGGDSSCDHRSPTMRTGRNEDRATLAGSVATNGAQLLLAARTGCGKCGARRVDQQLGLEAVHDCLGWATKQPCGECYICHMTEVFREVKRVVRSDGTLWINEGDSYAGGGGFSSGAPTSGTSKSGKYGNLGALKAGGIEPRGTLKAKDLCGMPWRLALSLQADGWYWRDAIVWDKPAPMPESVRDRCTKSWEPILMFSKNQRYYFDQEAIRESTTGGTHPQNRTGKGAKHSSSPNGFIRDKVGYEFNASQTSRNKRNVWRLPPMPVSAAHFATYPLELPETCILAGTSERGVCPECGAPWKRQVQRGELQTPESRKTSTHGGGKGTEFEQNGWSNENFKPGSSYEKQTTGWLPSCDHGLQPIPATAMDCFAGSGTTGLAALKHGRNFLGIELSAEYIEISKQRLADKLSLFA